MKNRLAIVNKWVEQGMPEGASFSRGNSGVWHDVSELLNLPVEELVKPFDCIYRDAPERWVNALAYEIIPKILKGKIRARRNTSLDNAWDEWHSIDEILLKDIFEYEYQYLAERTSVN